MGSGSNWFEEKILKLKSCFTHILVVLKMHKTQVISTTPPGAGASLYPPFLTLMPVKCLDVVMILLKQRFGFSP